MAEILDCVVIGSGVVGLAIARALAIEGREVVVVEAEGAIGTGISSRNSEVIHAGIYYPPGSLKAKLCVAGNRALYAYCTRKHVDHRRLGKLIVASREEHIAELQRYHRQAAQNGVRLEHLTAKEIKKLEPEVHCVAGLSSPSTGIVDSHGLMHAYLADLESHKGSVVLNTPVVAGSLLPQRISLLAGGIEIRARTVVNAAGLNAQSVSRILDGVDCHTIPQLFLAKGHYFSLSGRSPFRRLVYPIASGAGLGIHVTLDLSGNARFGPDVQWVEAIDYGCDNERRSHFCDAIRLYYPDLDEHRLRPAYAGIRPKLARETGGWADFCIRGPADHSGTSYVALYGIESPGLTASLALADHVVRLIKGSQSHRSLCRTKAQRQ